MSKGTTYGAIKAHLQDPDVVAVLADAETGNPPPFRFSNEPFTKPEPPAPWIAVDLTRVLYGQESIGASEQKDNRWDANGDLSIRVLVASGTGADRAWELAEAIADIFRGLTLFGGDLEFGFAFTDEGGPSEEEGNWYELPIIIKWRHVEA